MEQREYTVVVGLSARPQSEAALRWAAEQTRHREGRLVVCRVLRVGGPQATPAPVPSGRVRTAQEVVEDERRRLADEVARVLGPDHGAQIRVLRGNRRRALTEQAADADLLVIDTPRLAASSPLLAQRIVWTSPCPVVVVPPGVAAG